MTGARLRCYIYGLAASKSMIRKLEVSRKLQKRAEQMIPGGVNSPVRAFRSVGMDPPFIVRGQGSRLYPTQVYCEVRGLLSRSRRCPASESRFGGGHARYSRFGGSTGGIYPTHSCASVQ